MDNTQLTLIVAAVVSLLIQIVKDRWHLGNTKWFAAIVSGAVTGLTQAGNNGGVELSSAWQVLAGAGLAWGVHSGFLQDSPLGNALKSFGSTLAKSPESPTSPKPPE